MKGRCEDKGMVDLLFWVLGTNGLNAPNRGFSTFDGG